MRLSTSAVFSLSRLHVTRVAIGGLHRVPMLIAGAKSVSVGARRRFVEVFARNKSTMTLVDAPNDRSARPSIDTSVVLGVLSLVGTFGFGLLTLYLAIDSAFESKLDSKIKAETGLLATKIKSETDVLAIQINGVSTMLESKLDGQDRKLAGQDRRVDGFGEKVDSQDLRYERKKSWNWFGLYSSPAENEDRIASKVTEYLDAKFDALLKELKAKPGGQDSINHHTSSKK